MHRIVNNVDNFCKYIYRQQQKSRKILKKQEVWQVLGRFCGKCYVNRIIHRFKTEKLLINLWIMWISGGKYNKNKDKKVDKFVYPFLYILFLSGGAVYFKRASPTLTISPAPIVISKSPWAQFSSRNFSISSKEGK